jgi:hypothetical protein
MKTKFTIGVLVLALAGLFYLYATKPVRTVGFTPGDTFSGEYQNIGGIEYMYKVGSLTTGTGTMVYMTNPMAATTTVDFAQISEVTAPAGATTYTCGTTSVVGATASGALISTGVIPTSTKAFLVNGAASNFGGGNARVTLGPSDILACTASFASTTANNALAGTYKFRFVK